LNCGEEISCELVIARGNGAELLELAEELLDQVSRFIELLVIRAQALAIGAGGNEPPRKSRRNCT
jgi:hypothetical protein